MSRCTRCTYIIQCGDLVPVAKRDFPHEVLTCRLVRDDGQVQGRVAVLLAPQQKKGAGLEG